MEENDLQLHFAKRRSHALNPQTTFFMQPSLDNDFFSIGGDSLNMVQVISRLNDYGYFIGITDFALSNNMADVTMNLGTEQLTDDLKAVIEKLEVSFQDSVL